MRYLVQKQDDTVEGNISLPGSKSIANRLLMIRELSGGTAPIEGLPDYGDTLLMSGLLNQIRKNKGGNKSGYSIIDAGNTGTVFRFLTSYLSITPGNWLLTGSSRMLERPIGPLADALISLGADITYCERESYPPLRITGKKLNGGEVTLNGSDSSQFISSILFIAPLLSNGLSIHIQGNRVSEPYIDMTIGLMADAGMHILKSEDGYIVRQQDYKFMGARVETDWSAAACWFETVALSKSGRVHLNGLRKTSLQGDSKLPDIFSHLGVQSTFTDSGLLITKDGNAKNFAEFNMKDTPDLTPSLAVAMAGCRLNGVIRGINHLRIKESDRISSISLELKKTGYPVKIENNTLIFNGLHQLIQEIPRIHTHADHRIAMALAPIALNIRKLIIENPGVTEKSYNNFWEDLQSIGFQVDEI